MFQYGRQSLCICAESLQHLLDVFNDWKSSEENIHRAPRNDCGLKRLRRWYEGSEIINLITVIEIDLFQALFLVSYTAE